MASLGYRVAKAISRFREPGLGSLPVQTFECPPISATPPAGLEFEIRARRVAEALVPEARVTADTMFRLTQVTQHYRTAVLGRSNVSRLSATLDVAPAVSCEKFLPLLRRDVHGKYYVKATRTQEFAQASLFEGDRSVSQGARRPASVRARLGQPDGVHARTLDIFDLLFPSLMPPLDLNLPTQIDFAVGLMPYHYQWTGVKFLIDHESALLADETGTGKTVMACVALRVLFRQGRITGCLIVCPLVALGVWKEHIECWAPELQYIVVRGDRSERYTQWKSPAHVHLSTYDTVRTDFLDEDGPADGVAIDSFDVVLIDEAQHIKNQFTGKSQAVKLFAPKYRWAMSATPFETKVDDIASIFAFVRPHHIRSDGLTPSRARGLMQPYTLRRTKKEVKPEMPDKIAQEIWLDLAPAQQILHDAVLKQETDKLRELGEKVTRVHIFAVIQRLKQICNFVPGTSTGPKVDALLDKLEEITDSGKQVLVFSQYINEGLTKISQVLEGKGYRHVVYRGGMSERDRVEIPCKFKTDTSISVFLGQVRAAGSSLNLENATYVIHFDHWWNPSVMWQAEDRAYRITQDETVNVYSLWMENSIERKIHNKLLERGLLFQKIFGAMSEDAITEKISVDEWLEVLGVKTPAQPRGAQPTEAGDQATDQEVLVRLGAIDPLEFEQVVKQLFVKLGFQNARTTQVSHDGGVDIVATRTAIGGIERVVVQCKRMPRVGVEHARALLGVVTADTSVAKGFLVTNGEASPQCRDFCERNGKLSCIDGQLLAAYIRQFGIALAT